ncbi:hypothetical protein [Spirillospora sp. NPDC029432]|uniref:WapI family immunity protein n=1 Tax=Spirillospora sp. NPDC029432 TaxID=3154599 RepID=UPI00345508BC
MRLIGRDGHGIDLRIDGYQFPDAEDEDLRTSWLMIAGTAHSPEGVWDFRWQALTPDDAAYLAVWLRDAEEGGTLDFTEPNLSFTFLARTREHATLRIGLDLEFSPPWRKHTRAGDPFLIVTRLRAADLTRAAAAWADEAAAY